MSLKGSVILFFLCSFNQLYSQYIDLEGAKITVQQNATLTIQGSLIAETNGAFFNQGKIIITKDLINNSSNVLFLNNLPGEVNLNGNGQLIDGTDSISFFDLSLSGVNLSEKELNLSVSITNNLDLNNQILETHDNYAYVLNPSNNSIVFNNGFVESDSLGGYLIRRTFNTSEYVFPVGDINLNQSVRPVIITPTSIDTNMYGVRLASIDVNFDNTGVSASGAIGPFNSLITDNSIKSLNDKFYHNIYQFHGISSAKVEIYYDSFDGDYKTVTQWKSNSHHNAHYTNSEKYRFGLDRVMIKDEVKDFNDDVFTLADLNINIQVPNGISVNGDGLNDVLVIKGLEYFPNNKLVIFNRWGDVIYEESPYLNNWIGQSNVSGTFIKKEVVSGTYYYLLHTDLNSNSDPLQGFIELKKE